LAHNDAGNGIESENPYQSTEDSDETNEQAPKNHPGSSRHLLSRKLISSFGSTKLDDETIAKLKGRESTQSLLMMVMLTTALMLVMTFRQKSEQCTN